jgi:hypothetical protein
MDKTTESREKVKDFLKAKGKDPEKLMPDPKPPVPPTPEEKKLADEKAEKERNEQVSRALEAKKAEEEKLLGAKDETLSDEDKKKKKEVLELKKTEDQAQKESKVQKRIDELVGEIKALKAEKSQDKEKLVELESRLGKLQGTVERNPEKLGQEVAKLESERLKKYEDEGKDLPREKRLEMSRAELEEWLVEDIVAANEWLADRQLRRREERAEDVKKLRGSGDDGSKAKAEEIIRKQAESKDRVSKKHPELDVSNRIKELKAKGMNPKQIETTIFAENPKAKLVAEILREDPDTYMLSENGPELLAEEMEKRMAHKGESEEEKEERIAQEAAEAERQRQADIDADDLHSTRPPAKPSAQDKDPFYQKQLEIWRKAFPNESEAQIKARLDKRLKTRRAIGAM